MMELPFVDCLRLD